MSATPKWFPIMGRRAIPWPLIEPCARQAKLNHDQTLEQLASRGGLDSSEAVAVLESRRWSPLSREAADARLDELERAAVSTAITEMDEARKALGPAWLAGGVSLAEGIRRKTSALEGAAINAKLLSALNAADRILWMAEAYADGGGSGGPERRDYDEASAEIAAALAARASKGGQP